MANLTFIQDREHYGTDTSAVTATLFGLVLQVAVATCAAPAMTLRANDQALLDAIAPGNQKIWDHLLTEDAVYVDENGAILSRSEFLTGLKPLPSNTSGTISIVDYQVHVSGDTALVIHRDDERENYHGIMLRAAYLMTEAWLCRQGEWKLAMIHAYVEAKDPPSLAVPVAKLGEYVGRYSAAPDLTWTIRLEADHLVGKTEGGSAHVLQVEAPDVLFVPGQPRERRIFQRDGVGHITGFIERREGEDIPWKRVSRKT
ncbi:MAG: hypothetical protein JWO52_1966 [Gammaproteobacteria bacterium]|jgi:ketosteroid isomerase-like protein|nr:hypothetical protein [Gammaproteobacteria bacterium]